MLFRAIERSCSLGGKGLKGIEGELMRISKWRDHTDTLISLFVCLIYFHLNSKFCKIILLLFPFINLMENLLKFVKKLYFEIVAQGNE